MNETLFLAQIIVVIAFGYVALKIGKSALTAWICLQAVLANLFVLKQISLLGFDVTCGDVFAVGGIFGLNLLREYGGKDAAKQALKCCFFLMLFFVAMAQLHLLYQPNTHDTSQSAFEAILSSSPRLLCASLIAFFVSQAIDLRLFSLLKERSPSLPLSVRNGISLISAELLDTLLFSVLGLWGLVANLTDIIVLSFLIKLILIGCMSPLIHLSKRFVKREEAPDV